MFGKSGFRVAFFIYTYIRRKFRRVLDALYKFNSYLCALSMVKALSLKSNHVGLLERVAFLFRMCINFAVMSWVLIFIVSLYPLVGTACSISQNHCWRSGFLFRHFLNYTNPTKFNITLTPLFKYR